MVLVFCEVIYCGTAGSGSTVNAQGPSGLGTFGGVFLPPSARSLALRVNDEALLAQHAQPTGAPPLI